MNGWLVCAFTDHRQHHHRHRDPSPRRTVCVCVRCSPVVCVSPVRGASAVYYNSDMVEKGERQRLQREAEERKKVELQRLLNEQRQRDEARAAGGAASAAH